MVDLEIGCRKAALTCVGAAHAISRTSSSRFRGYGRFSQARLLSFWNHIEMNFRGEAVYF
jgi:hypothetical protein